MQLWASVALCDEQDEEEEEEEGEGVCLSIHGIQGTDLDTG